MADTRNRLSELVTYVEKTHARVTITKHGHPAVVLISPENLHEMDEALDVVFDLQALTAIRQAKTELGLREFTTGDEIANLVEQRKLSETGVT
ncbi:MAG: type II toxin-antitoxin system Phd/YefM family antitoxin [Acidimicrobiales bacterium]